LLNAPRPQRRSCLLLLALLLTTGTVASAADWSLDLEGGWAWSGYNDVRIPGEGGTEFSLSDDLSTEGTAFSRLRLSRRLGARHELSAFAAPLRLDASGRAPAEIDFAGERFPAGSDLSARYRFDSYRLTYRYRLRDGERFTGWLGLTAKIRDAEIAVNGAGRAARKLNTGFVPLLAFRGDWRLAERWIARLEGDALAGGPGRAEDVFLGLVHVRSSRLALRAGYRFIEGGADVEEVYNFALLNFASLGLELAF